jgi:hypothetical protein
VNNLVKGSRMPLDLSMVRILLGLHGFLRINLLIQIFSKAGLVRVESADGWTQDIHDDDDN